MSVTFEENVLLVETCHFTILPLYPFKVKFTLAPLQIVLLSATIFPATAALTLI